MYGRAAGPATLKVAKNRANLFMNLIPFLPDSKGATMRHLFCIAII